VANTRNRSLLLTPVKALLLVSLMVGTVCVKAQTSAVETGSAAPVSSSLALPDEPGAALAVARSAGPGAFPAAKVEDLSTMSPVRPEASHTTKFIEPGQDAPVLTTGDKVALGLRDAVSPFAIVGWFASAGYEQALNGSPNYGTDRGAFGQRLGAAALRDISEGIFSDSVMSVAFHEDPRYYRMGPSHNFFVRLAYAGTRPILSRTDSGHGTPNLALLTGTLAGSALASAYYPATNRGAAQTFATFGGSLGGSAIGDVVGEFFGDVMHHFAPKRY